MKYCKHSKLLYCFLVNKMGIKVLETSRPKSKKFKEWPLSIYFFLSKEFQEFVVLRSSFLSNVRLELFFNQYPLEKLLFSQLKCVFIFTESIAVKGDVRCLQLWLNHNKIQRRIEELRQFGLRFLFQFLLSSKNFAIFKIYIMKESIDNT